MNVISKIGSIVLLVLLSFGVASAQKAVLVDMEYILSNIPAYTTMNQQLEAQSKKWQDEVTKLENEASTLYKKYQAEASRLSPDLRKAGEDAIVAKEKEAYELKRRYFGPEGELVKKRESLMKPIQTEVWNTLKEIALTHGLQIILDKSSGKIVYADPNADISALVLQKMGYRN